jgi:hypothetical protein
VKEPQTLEPSAPTPPLPQGARYHYTSSPPTTVSLRLADVASQIPETARLPSFDADRSIELPCRDVFAGPVPKLSLSRLAQIAGEHICLRGVPDSVIFLPAGRLALAYRFVSGREILEETTKDSSDSRISVPEDFAPKLGFPESADGSVCPKGEVVEPKSEAQRDEANSQPAIASANEAPEAIPQTPDERESPAAPRYPDSGSPSHLIPVDLPSVLAHPAATESYVHAAREPAPALVREAVLEHLTKVELKGEIPDQDGLQSIFMTEEFLSVNRVVELCGGLPGIKSCVLAHRAAVVSSYNVPESIDLVSLSAHALDMLAAMRKSATQMGIGAVPAVTIHSEKGPITFFHQSDLCLLVLHKDRGFVPGVREKLQQVVEHLSRAKLALPVNASRPALTAREAAI